MHGAKKYPQMNKEYRDFRDLVQILDSLQQTFPGRFDAINDPQLRSLKDQIDSQLLGLQTKKNYVFGGVSAAVFAAARVLPITRLRRLDRFYLLSLFSGMIASKIYVKDQTKKTYDEFKPKFNIYLQLFKLVISNFI